jgi:hypothetical protein
VAIPGGMTRKLVAFATFSVLVSGCGAAAINTPSGAAAEPAPAPKPASATKPAPAAPASEVAEVAAPAPDRKVGDFTVQRYSGSYRKRPITLTEEVIAREGELLILDHTFEQAEQYTRFRARINLKSGHVVAVSRFENGSEVEAPLAAYEALIAQTVFAADSNEEKLGAEPVTCLVGGTQQDCELTSYRVIAAGKPAKLSIWTSKAHGERHVAGEITAEDGSVIYRAEVVERGSMKPSSSLAQSQEARPSEPQR